MIGLAETKAPSVVQDIGLRQMRSDGTYKNATVQVILLAQP